MNNCTRTICNFDSIHKTRCQAVKWTLKFRTTKVLTLKTLGANFADERLMIFFFFFFFFLRK